MRALTDLVAPAIGAVACFWLLLNLDSAAKILGVVWLAIGVAYLLYLTRFFRVAPPEVTWAE
jgi:putrescine importer